MKKWFKTASMLGLLVSVSLTLSSLPALAADGSAETAAAPAAKGMVTVRLGSPPLMISEVHQQAYLTYLVNEYDPESLDQWQEAFAQRQKAAADMPKPTDKGAVLKLTQGDQSEDQLKFNIAIPELSDVSATQSLPVTGPGRLFTVEMSDDVDGKNIIYINKKPGESIDPDGKIAAEMKASAQLASEFEKAVASGDAQDIKAVLPKVLEDYQKNTERMVNIAQSIKKELDDK
jgi:hypothetical protein